MARAAGEPVYVMCETLEAIAPEFIRWCWKKKDLVKALPDMIRSAWASTMRKFDITPHGADYSLYYWSTVCSAALLMRGMPRSAGTALAQLQAGLRRTYIVLLAVSLAVVVRVYYNGCRSG